MRQSGERVHGPYPHHNRWRLVVDKRGRRERLTFDTETQAKAKKEELLKEIAGRTVSDAVQAFVVNMRDRGLRVGTVDRAEAHLRCFFDLDTEIDGKPIRFARTGGFVEDLRPHRCEELYGALTKRVAVDTHRNGLATTKSFLKWCVKRGWIRSNPAEDITAIGQRNRGKKQLRIDEARKLVDLCIEKANAGDDAAVAVLVALLMGMRASEVTDRVVRDLDDEGRLLWIEVGKTKRSRRTLEVPAVLRPYVLSLAKDRAPDEQLLGRRSTKRGNKRGRQWLRHWLAVFCDEAKIPQVCSHSLRGLHATLATEAGVSAHAVASALGHTTPAVTHAHYIQAGTNQRVSARRVTAKLAEPTGSLQPLRAVARAEPTGSPRPVRPIAGTTRPRSVPAKAESLSDLSPPLTNLA
jgi:integrase